MVSRRIDRGPLSAAAMGTSATIQTIKTVIAAAKTYSIAVMEPLESRAPYRGRSLACTDACAKAAIQNALRGALQPEFVLHQYPLHSPKNQHDQHGSGDVIASSHCTPPFIPTQIVLAIRDNSSARSGRCLDRSKLFKRAALLGAERPRAS